MPRWRLRTGFYCLGYREIAKRPSNRNSGHREIEENKEIADKFFKRVLRLLKEPQINLIARKHNIDSRPFFPQVSSFSMFNNFNNPIAEHLADNGID